MTIALTAPVSPQRMNGRATLDALDCIAVNDALCGRIDSSKRLNGIRRGLVLPRRPRQEINASRNMPRHRTGA
jgi:hypothetical protein